MRTGLFCETARLAGLALIVMLAAPTALVAIPAAKAASKASADQARIDGFRGARFGMNTDEVKHAMEREFHLKAADIHAGLNPVQRTRALGARVDHLLPGAGPATVSYVFGYRSHRLIEVNIVWRTKLDPKANDPKALEEAGATLQAYFAKEHFPKGNTATNVALSNGTLILFRGIDADGHAVVVALNGKLSKSDKPKHVVLTPRVLSLVYAENPKHPDVFHLKKGSF